VANRDLLWEKTVKKLWIVGLVGLVLMAGCSGVILSAKYATLLDQSCAWSLEAATRADANLLSVADMKQALALDANFLRAFKDASKGQETK
jgi:hypothetical protein